jgi:Zn-dependent M28 family amino/carboxypeptidase
LNHRFVNLNQHLQTHLTNIVRERDPYIASGGHFLVQQYIQQQFSQWGSVEIHTFEVASKICRNLILNLPCDPQFAKATLPPILVGAHYDAVPGSPGADDNATGIAVLLELGRVFAAAPIKYPLRLIAFDMEEYGLLGSTSYATKLKQERQPVRLMFSLEMLGYRSFADHSQSYPPPLEKIYPHKGDFVALVGTWKTLGDLIRMSRSMRQVGVPSQWLPVPNRGLMVRETRRSDHAPFWDLGYPAILVTDTADMRNPHYHQPSDTVMTLDLDFLVGVCQGLERGIRNLSS